MRESRCMSLLPRTTVHSDSEHLLFWFGLFYLVAFFSELFCCDLSGPVYCATVCFDLMWFALVMPDQLILFYFVCSVLICPDNLVDVWSVLGWSSLGWTVLVRSDLGLVDRFLLVESVLVGSGVVSSGVIWLGLFWSGHFVSLVFSTVIV